MQPNYFLDLSNEQHDPPEVLPGASPKHRVVHGHVVRRNPKDVIGIGLHQTACVFGPSNNVALKHRRALRVAAHCTSFRDGTSVLGHPLDWYVYHGNGLNAFTLGLECEGLYRGTMRTDEHEISDIAIASFRFGLKELVERGRAAGMPIEFIWAHRQSSPMRRGDPGAEIWKRVVLEYAVPVLGLKTDNSRTWGQGKPIPKEWDPSATSKY